MIKVSADHTPATGGIVTLKGLFVELDIDIQGSAKQVAWATRIASAAIQSMASQIAVKNNPNGLYKEEELAAVIASMNAQLQEIEARIDGSHASLWIDNRHLSAGGIVREVAKARK